MLMKNLKQTAILTLSLGALTGCEALLGFLLPTTTRVQLINNGDFPVEVTLYISDEQDIPESLLTELGDELVFTIGPGETTSFARDCDALQAIIIDDADLQLIGEVGPEADTGVLRDGDDFGCGDAIVFTFDHSAVIVDFDISVSVVSP